MSKSMSKSMSRSKKSEPPRVSSYNLELGTWNFRATLCPMSSQSGQLDDTVSQAARCREGDLQALAELRQQCHASLTNILLARGATRTEADDLLADLWADCVPGNAD